MSHRFVYFEARVNEAMKTVIWTWNGLMKIELEMVSDEDWTWNGLWWRLDLKWSLMKIGLEMVSEEVEL